MWLGRHRLVDPPTQGGHRVSVTKTETVIREYDADGNLLKETTTVVQLGVTPTEQWGMYL